MEKLTIKQLKSIYKIHKKNGKLSKNLTGMKKQEIINELKGNGLKDIYESVKKFLFFPSSKMPDNSQKILDKYKSNTIKKIEVYREPIEKAIQGFFNLISLGKYNDAKKNGSYDDLYHLYMILTLDDNTKILLEKNENIYIRDKFDKGKDAENINISLKDTNLNLDELLYKTEKLMGKFKFYQYNSKSNNCQDFIMSILKANGLDNDEYTKFIKQNLEKLFENLPSWSNKFSQLMTDTRAKINEIFGLGKKKRIKKYAYLL